YVTPGPLALYRKTALQRVGGFDKNNLTEDIELTWALAHLGYKRKMCLATNVTTTVPHKFIVWYKQRRRWNTGGLQCISKYKGLFLKRGMLGMFILPFFILQLFNGLLGLSVFTYLTTTRVIRNYLFVKYSTDIGTSLITMNDLYITPSFLNYVGVIMFVAGLIFTLLALFIMKEKALVKQNVFALFFYFIFYLSVYPFIVISAVYNYFKGGKKWM
ncbi:MAG: glycosyltransferase family 2 protein, partial [Nanoarchaeota archaeon]